MIKRYLLIAFLNFFFVGNLAAQSSKNPQLGSWRAELRSQGGGLPFNLSVAAGKQKNTFIIKVINGSESFHLGESYFRGDSLVIPFDLYDSEIVARLDGSQKMTGYWIKKRNGKFVNQLPFSALYGSKERFTGLKTPKINVSGTWNVDIAVEDKHTPSVGVFKQVGNKVTGSILQTSGDYRFLQGNVSGDSLFVSYFDGSFVLLFKTKVTGKEINGTLFSGFATKKEVKGNLDPKASLPDLKKLTFLKPGYDRLNFSLPTPKGETISLQDERFKNKVVIVEIMGSWCPNCIDEARFLAPFYSKNKAKGVEVVGVSFEYSPEMAVSGPKIENFKKKIGIDYPLVFGGVPNDETIAQVFPMLNKFYGYPTTFVIDKKGKVREIHTGFSGPGTGLYYTDWVQEFEKTIQTLLKEK
ncbi:peroxiredoxin family protein [Aquirufa aurantiipilula]|uniref:TlpA disulfide reductase family protein n=1 Tax=Aquirufa aurantiipilula TaxID=2696561 RepID=A0ABT6BJY7_9BACT|nr:TlpA disulfide reductase family protein [Aquirufa aurantiipilula]MDF5690540.1 TlpA disulfide reductase family protein [Aquirufa aurantiipilula]